MKPYLELLEELERNGKDHDNRTGVNTIRKIFHHNEYETYGGTRFNAVSHKRLAIKSVLAELIGFITGTDDAKVFGDLGCNVWYENANNHGVNPNKWLSSPFRKGENDLGRIYGVQWRKWEDVKLHNVISDDDYSVRVYDEYLRLGYKVVGEYSTGVGSRTFVLRREIDQLFNAIRDIMTNPGSRRIIIHAWNPPEIEMMALPPCHLMQQYLCTILTPEERLEAYKNHLSNDELWYIHKGDTVKARTGIRIHSAPQGVELDVWLERVNAPKYRLDLIMYQRSADTVLGSPFNISSYDAMLNVMGRITNTAPGSLHYVTADTHIYKNHTDAVKESLGRGVHPDNAARLLINPALRTLEDFESATTDDFLVINYANFGKLESPTPMAI